MSTTAAHKASSAVMSLRIQGVIRTVGKEKRGWEELTRVRKHQCGGMLREGHHEPKPSQEARWLLVPHLRTFGVTQRRVNCAFLLEK